MRIETSIDIPVRKNKEPFWNYFNLKSLHDIFLLGHVDLDAHVNRALTRHIDVFHVSPGLPREYTILYNPFPKEP